MNIEQTPFDYPSRHLRGPEPLAHLRMFTVGPITVEPALRKLVGTGGKQALVEPLVMQVLVALARSGEVPCSRDDLVSECWDRRIVGDDAVNRIISILRRHLSAVAGDAVAIETIPKVGYRLQVAAGAIEPGDEAGRQIAEIAPRTGRGVHATAVAVTVAIAALLGSAMIPRSQDTLAMTIEPVTASRGTVGFASDLNAEISRLMSPMTALTLVEPGGSTAPDLSLKVSYTPAADSTEHSAQVQLVDRLNGAVVWAREFTGLAPAIVRERAAYGIAGVLRCGLHRSSGDLGDPVSKRLYLAACDAVEAFDWPRAHSLAKQIVARRPDSAASWACLALATANLAHATPEQRSALAIEAERQAREALSIDPDSGLAHQAMAAASELTGRPAMPMLEEGVRRDPEHSGLLARYSRALAELGYVRAAVDPAQRASALEPNSYFAAQAQLLALLGAGELDEAARLDAQVKRIWNDSHNTGYTRNAILFYQNDPIRALTAFDRDPPVNPSLATRQRFELQWRAAPSQLNWAAFDRFASAAFAKDSKEAWYNAFSAVRMGDLERGFAWLERAPRDARGVATLFWPDASGMRRDRRFFAKMKEIGHVESWIARREWPDFCADPKLTYDCKTEAENSLVR